MVQSKTKRESDPYEALNRLMDEPGDIREIVHDVLGNFITTPRERLVRALSGPKEYDDRAAAIVFGSMLELCLEQAISTHFVIDDKEIRRIFSYSNHGPLPTFADKITIGYALGVYETKMRDDLKLVKAIRNAFAHARNRVSFETDAIKLACANLTLARREAVIAPSPDQRLAPRLMYTSTIALLCPYLMGMIDEQNNPIRYKASEFYASIYLREPSP